MFPLAAALLVALAAGAAPADGGPAEADPYDAAMRAGDEAFEGRADKKKLEAALAAYDRAESLRPDDPAATVRLARVAAFQALSAPRADAAHAWDSCARTAEHALRHLSAPWAAEVDQGKSAADAAAKVDAAGAEALYWLSLASMSAAQARGFAAVLLAKDAARAGMERVLALDEKVDHAGPHRALGAWLAALPSAVGGGAAGARAHFDKARSLAPGYLLTPLREAETWAVLVQDKKRFDALLDEVAKGDDSANPRAAPENAVAKKLAKELGARKARLF
jgi:hypothetical protein